MFGLFASDPTKPPTLLHRIFYALTPVRGKRRPALTHLLLRSLTNPTKTKEPITFWRSILRLPVCFDIAVLYLQFRDVRNYEKGLKSDESDVLIDGVHKAAYGHNSAVLKDKRYTLTRRMEPYLKILSVPARDMSQEDFLSIGPRNVVELFVAWLHGFSWERISGIDLFSVNPKIKAMNMEAMTFADESFDAIVACHTVGYASDLRKALTEVARVLRPGGRFVMGMIYAPELGGSWDCTRSGREVFETLSEAGLEVYFYEPIIADNRSSVLQVVHIYGFRKPPVGEINLDKQILKVG